MAKEKKFRFTTPEGVAKFPHLNEPDYKFSEAGDYHVKLVLTPEEAQPLIDKLQPHFDAAVEEGKKADKKRKPPQRKKKPFEINDLYSPEYDADGNETGNYEFNFSTKASGVSKKTGKRWEKEVPVFDSKRKPIDLEETAIWGGSIIKVASEASPYFIPASGACGLKLYLNAVQVIDLVTSGGGNAAAYGFGDEDGYEAEEADGGAFADDEGDDKFEGLDEAEAALEGEEDF